MKACEISLETTSVKVLDALQKQINSNGSVLCKMTPTQHRNWKLIGFDVESGMFIVDAGTEKKPDVNKINRIWVAYE